MTNISEHQGQNTQGNDDFRYHSLDVLSGKPQLEKKSGRYKENVVP